MPLVTIPAREALQRLDGFSALIDAVRKASTPKTACPAR